MVCPTEGHSNGDSPDVGGDGGVAGGRLGRGVKVCKKDIKNVAAKKKIIVAYKMKSHPSRICRGTILSSGAGGRGSVRFR